MWFVDVSLVYVDGPMAFFHLPEEFLYEQIGVGIPGIGIDI
jgi:hypothetical protein